MSQSSSEPGSASISASPSTAFCFLGNLPTLLVFAFRDGSEEFVSHIN